MEEPSVIRKLDETVVNRIAAGEIIQRPANALKELLENSLDAKSTNISITVKAGGLKYLQIQDNGTGIRREDMEIVCERFTTSKLRQFEDLQEISTYGFRGEALASISHVAHLTILTKTASDKCAYKASYEDGKLKGAIKACAGNQGTQITVEDLFYNVIARKRALRSASEEYSRVLEVVSSYAVHNAGVGFVLKKFGENADLRTPLKSTPIENIRMVYGNTVARELMEVSVTDAQLRLSARGLVTNLNYSHKKDVMLLFINHRLVESTAIRRSIDSIYSVYLPKNGHSFIYLSLEIDPHNVDVNVHPTKHEVHFLHEEQIIVKLKLCIEEKLLSCGNSRVMYTQARLPGATEPLNIQMKPKDATERTYANNMVRTDSTLQKIEKFFRLTEKKEIDSAPKETEEKMDCDEDVNYTDDSITKNLNVVDVEISEAEDTNKPDVATNVDSLTKSGIDDSNFDEEAVEKRENKAYVATNEPSHSEYVDPKESFKTRKFAKSERIETKLTSIRQLRVEVENACSPNLRDVLANLIFIGCVDQTRSLIQFSTKLFLCNTTRLAEELFYETLLYDFQNFGYIKLSTAIPLQELAVLALDLPDTGWTPEDGDKRELSQQISELLIQKRLMLLEYFSLEIDEQGNLLALPLLIDNYTPYMGALPVYIVRLATEVNWDNEKECFRTFCRQTAIFYSQPNPDPKPETSKSELWTQEHVLFPALRKYFLPPRDFASNGALLQIANLPDLYKVFERC